MRIKYLTATLAASAFARAAGAAQAEDMETGASWSPKDQEGLYEKHMELTRKANSKCEDLGGSASAKAQTDDRLADRRDACVRQTLDSMAVQTGNTGVVLVHMALPADVRYNESRTEAWKKRAMEGTLVTIREESES
jgi:hypothetical protein